MSHYDVLGVRPDADAAEVRRAYLRLARLHHPDRTGGDLARMRAVNAAWAVLGDPARRRAYDDERGHRPGVAPPGAWSTPADGAPAPRLPLDEDEPVRITVVLPRGLTLLPVGLFASGIGIGILGVLLALGPLLALALLAFVLSGVFFVASPFLALYASRRPTRGGPPDGPR